MKKTILSGVLVGLLALSSVAYGQGGFSAGPAGAFNVNDDGSIDIGGAVSIGGTLAVDGAISGGVAITSGTGSVSTVTAADADYGNMKKTTLTLDSVPILITADAITNAWGSVKVYDFPEGRILVHGVTAKNVKLTVQTNKLPIASGGDIALGTVAASSNVLTGTMVDLLPSTSIDAITNALNGALAAAAQFDGTTTAKDMYVNVGVDQCDFIAGSTTATNSVSGIITIHWTNLGDY